jgi:serine/threonine protein kinase
MAEVYLARSHGIDSIDKLVAVKLVSAHLADDPAFVAMLRQEARIVTNLDHPNIASVIDFAVSDGESFLVTEYVHGYSLYDVLHTISTRGLDMPMGVAVGIARAVAEALHYAHEACDADGRPLGIVHRDVSPSNVLLRYDGVVKVVDFGIAKATGVQGPTESGMLKGKCSYMSPEQCNALAIDRRSDVFALGIVLFELTTGRRLFGGRNDFEVMNRITRGDVVPPSKVRAGIPEALERVVLRALATKPGDRFANAAAMQAELEAFAREERLDTSPLRLRELLDEVMGPRPHPARELESSATYVASPSGSGRNTAARGRRRRVGLALAGGTITIAALTVLVAQALASAPQREAVEATHDPYVSPPQEALAPTPSPAAREPAPPIEAPAATTPAPPDRARARRRSTRARTPLPPRRPSAALFPDGG